jgi:ABC-type uncharacterized transport system substrate-binding protein
MRRLHPLLSALALAAALVLLPAGADAHPHVWVTVKATVLYDNGMITGLQQEWTFDEMYTAMAIEGLDKNHDGNYDRQELSELAQVNIDGLKEFDYFTFAKLGNAQQKFQPPVDYWLDYTREKILTLHLTLLLQKPVAANAAEFDFSVFDPSYFIAFDFAKDNPIKLGAKAPATCSAAIREPVDEDDPNSQALNNAFSGALGTSANAALGGATRSVAVHCAKS